MSHVSMSARSAGLMALSVVGVASSMASAALTAPAWTRPTSGAQALADTTSYSQWDFFTDDDAAVGIQDTSPEIANLNPYGSESVTSQRATILGSGNLYNQTLAIDVALTVPNANVGSGVMTQFLLQVQTQGAALISGNDFSKFTVNGQPLANYNPTLEQISTAAGPQGAIVDNIIRFTLDSNLAEYVIAWEPTGGSSSHRVISIDTSVVAPEPTTLGLLTGLASLGLVRRRRA